MPSQKDVTLLHPRISSLRQSPRITCRKMPNVRSTHVFVLVQTKLHNSADPNVQAVRFEFTLYLYFVNTTMVLRQDIADVHQYRFKKLFEFAHDVLKLTSNLV